MIIYVLVFFIFEGENLIWFLKFFLECLFVVEVVFLWILKSVEKEDV